MDTDSIARDAATGKGPSIDLTQEADRAMVRRLFAKHRNIWPGIDDGVKAVMVAGLCESASVARGAMAAGGEAALAGANIMTSTARTVVAMVAQVQADLHLAEKHARIDAGLSTEVTEHKLYSVEATDLIEGV
jgi:hypothetical protein